MVLTIIIYVVSVIGITYLMYQVFDKSLLSLADNTQLNGTFTLGCGNIKEDAYYTYLYKTVNGGLKYDKILCDQCEIRFTTGVPRIIKEVFIPNDFIEFWIQPLPKEGKSIILIPEESVLKQIRIDLK